MGKMKLTTRKRLPDHHHSRQRPTTSWTVRLVNYFVQALPYMLATYLVISIVVQNQRTEIHSFEQRRTAFENVRRRRSEKKNENRLNNHPREEIPEKLEESTHEYPKIIKKDPPKKQEPAPSKDQKLIQEALDKATEQTKVPNLIVAQSQSFLGQKTGDSPIAPSNKKSDSMQHQGRLATYWINLDDSQDRRTAMESNFERLSQYFHATRIPATTKLQVEHRDDQHGISFQNIVLVPSDNEPNYAKHKRNLYAYEEAACTVSHLRMIQAAYDDGRDFALFLEDDVILDEAFGQNWQAYLNLAPEGWKALQLVTNNRLVYTHGKNSKDPWISWQPAHWSTAAYILNRRGMETILSQSMYIDQDGQKAWKILVPKVVVADELIYSLAGATYTSTYPWIGLRKASTTVQNVGSDLNIISSAGSKEASSAAAHQAVAIPKKRPEKVLVYTCIRIPEIGVADEEIERLFEDVHAMSSVQSNHTWVVNLVVPVEGFEPKVLNRIKTRQRAGDDVRIFVRVINDNFNKFRFLPEFYEMLPKYDFLLLKDSDIRIAGFPWRTFMERRGDSVITGTLCEAREESLFKNEEAKLRQYNQLHNGRWWKANPRTWAAGMFVTATAFDVKLVEMFFAFMRTDFAMWYFPKVLTSQVQLLPSDYGMDIMWCAA